MVLPPTAQFSDIPSTASCSYRCLHLRRIGTVTKIDRYILYLFLRTVLVCFCSIAGIFIVFHAFTSMDDLVKQGQIEDGLVPVMFRYYGPYMLMLFDWTGAIIALMAFLFTVGWLRRIGELTAILSSGISHGRLFRPMIIASSLIVLVQLANREFVLPHYRDALSMKPKESQVKQTSRSWHNTTRRIVF